MVIKRIFIIVRFKVIVFLFYTIFSFSLQALDPDKPINRYLLDEWKKTPCLTHVSINAIAQSVDHFLWFGTPMGLIRFDGLEFEFFDLKKILNVEKNVNFISELYTDSRGSMWISVDHGLVEYRKNSFKLYSNNDGLIGNYIMAIYEDMMGGLWLGTLDNYLNRFKDGKFEHFGSASGLRGNRVTSIQEDNKGFIWIGTFGNGLFRRQDNKFEKPEIEGIGANICIQAMVIDGKGSVWLGTKNGLKQIKNDRVEVYRSIDGLWQNNITSLLEDRDGNLWVGTARGLNRVKKSAGGDIIIEKILKDNYIRSLFEDREKNLWIGTQGDGIKRLKNSLFYAYSKTDGLPDQISTLFEDQKGTIWIGSGLGKIFVFENGSFKERKFKGKLPEGSRISAINKDLNNDLWIGSYGSGLFKLSNNRLFSCLDRQDLNGAAVIALECDVRGGMWIGTSNRGVIHYHQGNYRSYNKEHGLLSNKVYCILEDSRQNVWVGTDNGIRFLPKGVFNKNTVKEFYKGMEITNFFEDSANHIWITTIDTGHIIAKGNKFIPLSMNEGLKSNVLFSTMEDQQGDFWISCNAGVMMIRNKVFQDFISGKLKSVECKLYDLSDGIKSREFSWFSNYNGIKTRTGELWFATNKGIAAVNPAQVTVNKIAPGVVLKEIYVNGKLLSERKELNALRNIIDITFNFTAPMFSSPGKVKFKYTLDEVNKNNKDTKILQQRTVSYQNLPPGTYKLQVMASNRDGIWSRKEVSIGFTVKPAFTETFIYRIIIIILPLAILFFLYRWLTLVLSGIKKRKRYRQSIYNSKEALKIKLRLINLIEIEKIHLNNDISLKSLAIKLGTSPRFLSQVINVHFDKNFWDLINSYRIETAKDFLVESERNDLSILEIAFNTGYNSKEVFNRAFKKHTGMTPTRFKKTSSGSG